MRHVLPTMISAVLLAATAVAAADANAQTRVQRLERTITVTASGIAAATPDVAHITTGVVVEAATAREALTANSASMTGLISGIKALGVDPKDLQTSALRVEPRYTSPRDGGTPTINGYRVVNDIAVTVRNLERLGEILDKLVSLGANQMSGLSFEVSNAETLKDEARKDAMANALRRANLYAQAAGVTVGGVLSISEDTQQAGSRAAMFERSAMSKSVPIEPGTELLEARVTVTWALR